jgi:predicted RNA-binding Zn-ribbon protein involved in translation (DUF1610 family)
MVHVKCKKCGEIRYRATMPCEVIVDGAGTFLEQRELKHNYSIEGPYVCENCGWVLTELPITTQDLEKMI